MQIPGTALWLPISSLDIYSRAETSLKVFFPHDSIAISWWPIIKLKDLKYEIHSKV